MSVQWGRCGVWGCRNNHIGLLHKIVRTVQGVRFYKCVRCGELFCSEHAGRDPRVRRTRALRQRKYMRCPKCGGEKKLQRPAPVSVLDDEM